VAGSFEVHAAGEDEYSITLLRPGRIHGSVGGYSGRFKAIAGAEVNFRAGPYWGGTDNGGFGYPIHFPSRVGLHCSKERVFGTDERGADPFGR